ncbi:PilZ domain-containing protein [Marinobacter sp.]|uniref:PilZ domain-containing protein n=1 Tax=Marinobacter sp. TaxID=50741 RepID=UPI00384E49DE
MKETTKNDPFGPQRVAMKPVSPKPNLRKQQRVGASVEVTARPASGGEVRCTCTDISRAGMTVSCDLATANSLIPDLKSPAPGEWLKVALGFSLQVVAAQSVKVSGEGLIVHVRRISRDTFQIGIRFNEFEGNGHDYVSQFVSRQLSRSG